MKEVPVTVTVIIPCCNEAPYIESCLRSALQQEIGNLCCEVIIADGMSDDGTRLILNRLSKHDGRLKVVDNPQRIVSTGLNAAIEAARGKIIIRMDAHTQYAPDYIRQCVRVLEETGADNVGGPWIARGDGYVSLAIAAAFESPFAFGGARSHNPRYEGEVDTVYLGCWPREVFDRIGLFDEELVRNQDDELNLRLVRAGGRIWQSSRIRSWYQPRSSLRDLFRQYLQYGYWKVRVIQKHRLPASLRHVVPAAFVTCTLVLALAVPFATLPANVLMAFLATYGLCVMFASVATASRQKLRLLPVIPLIFACCHFSYGLGFLRGVWDFLIRRRSSPFARRLTRPTKPVVSEDGTSRTARRSSP